VQRGQRAAVAQGEFERGNVLRRTIGQIGNHVVFNLLADPLGAAQEDAGIGLAVNGSCAAVNIHGEHSISNIIRFLKGYKYIISVHKMIMKIRYIILLKQFM